MKPNTIWNWLTKNVQTLDATGGIKRFPDYPFLRDMVDALDMNRIIIIAKSRQMFATWTISAWMLYRALYEEPGVYLLLSKGARDTNELVKRLKLMISRLPRIERSTIKVKNHEIECENGSRILSLPATEDAVRMHSPSGIFWDEMAFTPYSEAIWTSVKPAIDSGGIFIGVSTPNGTDNVFYKLFNDHQNGFGKIKLHWTLHPRRDEEWKAEAQRGLSEVRWRQEYEIDFNVLVDRIYSEYDSDIHVLSKPYRWKSAVGRTFRAIDFGYRHPYIIWAHLLPDGMMIIFDEWEGRDEKLDDMAQAIHNIDRKHGITEADIYQSACDPAGAAITDAGISPVERLKKQGFKLIYRQSEIMTGVELVKSMLKDAAGRVSLKFSPVVERTLYHLRHYRWDSSGNKPSKDDGHDHAVDALRYLIINLFGQKSKGWSGAKVMGTQW